MSKAAISCTSLGGSVLMTPHANDQGDPLFITAIGHPVAAAVVEGVQVARHGRELAVFEAKRLLGVALDLHGKLFVVPGVPSLVHVRLDLAAGRHTGNQHTAQLPAAHIAHYTPRQRPRRRDLVDDRIPDAFVCGVGELGRVAVELRPRAKPYPDVTDGLVWRGLIALGAQRIAVPHVRITGKLIHQRGHVVAAGKVLNAKGHEFVGSAMMEAAIRSAFTGSVTRMSNTHCRPMPKRRACTRFTKSPVSPSGILRQLDQLLPPSLL